jgi:membrane protease YdiL (CAAX protease family)
VRRAAGRGGHAGLVAGRRHCRPARLPGWFRLGWVLLVVLLARIAATIWHLAGDETGRPGLARLLPLLVTLVVAIMALTAVAEELVFRGLLLTSLLEAFGNSRAGIYRAAVLASAIFGAGHLVVNRGPSAQLLAQAADAAAVGLVWAGLRLRTGSIWPGAVLHWLGNTTAMLTMLGSTPAWWVGVPMMRLSWAHQVFLPLLALAGVGLIEDHCKSLECELDHQQPTPAQRSSRDEPAHGRP